MAKEAVVAAATSTSLCGSGTTDSVCRSFTSWKLCLRADIAQQQDYFI